MIGMDYILFYIDINIFDVYFIFNEIVQNWSMMGFFLEEILQFLFEFFYILVEQVFMLFFLILMMIGIIIGNFLVCIVVVLVKRFQIFFNFLILFFVVLDLLVVVLVMFLVVIYEVVGYWLFGDILCDIFMLLDVILCIVFILNLCMISVDRYFVIMCLFQYVMKWIFWRMGVMIVSVWVLFVVIFIFLLLGWKFEKLVYVCFIS